MWATHTQGRRNRRAEGANVPPDFSNQLTLFQPGGGQIMPTTILFPPIPSCLPTALHTLRRLLLPSADYVNRKSPVMTICIVKWWPFSNQTNIQCYSSILQHGKVPSSIYSWSIKLFFLLNPRFKSWVVAIFFSFFLCYVSLYWRCYNIFFL